MSILSLPSLIKQLYTYSRTTTYHYNTSIINLLNRYQGCDWTEHITYKTSHTTSFPLYKEHTLSLDLVGISKKSTFLFDKELTYHIKVLNGKMKIMPFSSVINNVYTVSSLDYEHDWIENSFSDHSTALIVSHRPIKML